MAVIHNAPLFFVVCEVDCILSAILTIWLAILS